MNNDNGTTHGKQLSECASASHLSEASLFASPLPLRTLNAPPVDQKEAISSCSSTLVDVSSSSQCTSPSRDYSDVQSPSSGNTSGNSATSPKPTHLKLPMDHYGLTSSICLEDNRQYDEVCPYSHNKHLASMNESLPNGAGA